MSARISARTSLTPDADAFLALAKSDPLTSIKIGPTTYAIGPLSADQRADLDAWGKRLMESGNAGKMPTREELAAGLLALLTAGNAEGVKWQTIAPYVSAQNIVAAGQEVIRQFTIAALASFEGRA